MPSAATITGASSAPYATMATKAPWMKLKNWLKSSSGVDRCSSVTAARLVSNPASFPGSASLTPVPISGARG